MYFPFPMKCSVNEKSFKSLKSYFGIIVFLAMEKFYGIIAEESSYIALVIDRPIIIITRMNFSVSCFDY